MSICSVQAFHLKLHPAVTFRDDTCRHCCDPGIIRQEHRFVTRMNQSCFLWDNQTPQYITGLRNSLQVLYIHTLIISVHGNREGTNISRVLLKGVNTDVGAAKMFSPSSAVIRAPSAQLLSISHRVIFSLDFALLSLFFQHQVSFVSLFVQNPTLDVQTCFLSLGARQHHLSLICSILSCCSICCICCDGWSVTLIRRHKILHR